METYRCWKCGSPRVAVRRLRVGRLRTTSEQIARGAEDHNIYQDFCVCSACDYKFWPHQDRYLKKIVYNPQRNARAAELAVRFSRLRQIVLVYVGLIEHGRLLEDGIRARLREQGLPQEWVSFVHGERGGEENDQEKERFAHGERRVLIATSVFGEGTNIVPLRWGIYAKAGDPGIELEQFAGRLMRRCPGKWRAGLIDFWDLHDRIYATKAKARRQYLARRGFIVSGFPTADREPSAFLSGKVV